MIDHRLGPQPGSAIHQDGELRPPEPLQSAGHGQAAQQREEEQEQEEPDAGAAAPRALVEGDTAQAGAVRGCDVAREAGLAAAHPEDRRVAPPVAFRRRVAPGLGMGQGWG